MSPLRAVAGATLAVAGVALGIGALLLVRDGSADPLASIATAAPPTSVDPQTSAEREAERQAADDAPAVAPSPSRARVASPTAGPRSTAASPVPSRSTVPSSSPAPSRPPVAVRAPAPARPTVVVLNNSTRTGLADRATARFSRAGWPVRLTGNYRGRIRATTVYYPAGQRAAATRFATTFRGIARVLPRPATLPGPSGLVVVLTRDFPA